MKLWIETLLQWMIRKGSTFSMMMDGISIQELMGRLLKHSLLEQDSLNDMTIHHSHVYTYLTQTIQVPDHMMNTLYVDHIDVLNIWQREHSLRLIGELNSPRGLDS
ncbi:MAG: hypothetical protein M0Q41_10845 [Bacteroidales bacterium]|nr:hypothetical protein [Bacteroidales bacterium]